MAPSGTTRTRVTTILLVAVPLVLLIGALGFIAWTWNVVRNSDPAEGTVISVETFRTDSGATYRPTFGYTDAEGNRRRATTPYASSEYDYAAGDRVGLLIPRDNPNRARIDSLVDLWLLPGVLLAAAVISLIVVVGFLMFARAARARAAATAPD